MTKKYLIFFLVLVFVFFSSPSLFAMKNDLEEDSAHAGLTRLCPHETSIDNLSSALVTHIFTYLPPGDLRRAGQVSTRWRMLSLIIDPVIFRVIAEQYLDELPLSFSYCNQEVQTPDSNKIKKGKIIVRLNSSGSALIRKDRLLEVPQTFFHVGQIMPSLTENCDTVFFRNIGVAALLSICPACRSRAVMAKPTQTHLKVNVKEGHISW